VQRPDARDPGGDEAAALGSGRDLAVPVVEDEAGQDEEERDPLIESQVLQHPGADAEVGLHVVHDDHAGRDESESRESGQVTHDGLFAGNGPLASDGRGGGAGWTWAGERSRPSGNSGPDCHGRAF
jgi:hypothetical protein